MKRWGVFAVLGFVGVLGIVLSIKTPTVVIGVAINDRVALSSAEGAMLSVVQSYVTWHNGRRGPYRFKLEIASYRDDPTLALEDLASRGAVAVVGFPLSLEATVAASVAEDLGLPVISPAASSSALTGKKDWFFRVVEDSQGEGSQLSEFFEKVGTTKVAVYRSPYNDAYVNQLIDDMVSHSSLNLGDISGYPEMDCCVSGDAVLVVAEPSRTYWIVQEITLYWPPVPVVLARWCQSSDFKTILEIPGSSFYFASNYDPSVIPDDPFTSFLVEERNLDLGLFVRQGMAAMFYLSNVLEENPRAKGEELRSLLSKPREVFAPGWSLMVDEFGDCSADLRFFLLKDGAVSEVEP